MLREPIACEQKPQSLVASKYWLALNGPKSWPETHSKNNDRVPLPWPGTKAQKISQETMPHSPLGEPMHQLYWEPKPHVDARRTKALQMKATNQPLPVQLPGNQCPGYKSYLCKMIWHRVHTCLWTNSTNLSHCVPRGTRCCFLLGKHGKHAVIWLTFREQ